MAEMGHNQGPTLEPGQTYRTFQWRQAQRALMPNTMPLMIIRIRVMRARELGMDYQTYASVRQASGQDILALMFSSNALRVIGPGAKMPDAEERALKAVKAAKKLALIHAPQTPPAVLQANPVLDASDVAPKFTDSWSDMRERLARFVCAQKLPSNQVLIIGDTALEREWATAAKAGGYLSAHRYFAASP
jgi:hypothetical protein